MQITCHIDQPEAIRRGFNANSTVKLEIDPATLTPDQRDTLAEHFRGGEFKGINTPLIPQPDNHGFLETLNHLTTKRIADKAEKLRRKEELIAEVKAAFAARKTKSTPQRISAVAKADGTITIEQGHRYRGDDPVGEALYNLTQPQCPTSWGDPDVPKTWDALLATPEGVTWLAELEAANTAAKDEAIANATADYHTDVTAKQRKAEQQAADIAAARAWSLAHGDETLRLRCEEDINWIDIARKQWLAAAIATAGISLAEGSPPPGYEEPEVLDIDDPDASVLTQLRDTRHKLDGTATVELCRFRYSPEDYQYEPDLIDRYEIEVAATVFGQRTIHFLIAE